MKTLAITRQVAASTPATAQPVFWRFAWKEFRMLRGFWLAVGGLAMAQQAISLVVRAPGTNAATMLFASALGAAALYAVGAAAMLFAVEHEEGTYSFLSSLPTTWLPVFGGKMLVATASAAALAGTLCLSGRLLAGCWPMAPDMLAYTGLFGIAIIEALAWGTLFSLRIQRPLSAALLAICAVTLVVQLLANLGADSVTPSWMVESYQRAIPWRLFIVAVVLVADVLLARRWWPVPLPVPSCDPVGGNREHASGYTVAEPIRTTTAIPITTNVAQSAAGITSKTCSLSVLRMTGRLGWQTCRASWPAMLTMLLAISLLELLVLALLLPLADPWNLPGWLLTLGLSLAGSALYGSAVFHADQKRQQFRFLAEHAGRGRIAWFCRLAVWGGGLGLLLLVGWLGCWLYAAVAIEEHASHLARAYIENSYTIYRDLESTAHQWAQFNCYIHGIGVGIFGIFAGLAVGQFSSLLMRRSLISALLAATLAAILVGWSALVIAWALPWWSCLFPVPLGLFWAAWLRVPDWLIERNTIRCWSKVLAAAGLPVLLVAGLLPAMRLGQVPNQNAARQRVEGLLSEVSGNATIETRRAGDQLLLLNPQLKPIKLPKQHRDDNHITEAERFAYHRQQVTANRQILAQACAQIASQTCNFPPLCVSGVWQQPIDKLRELATLATWAGDMTTADGQLDRALEYYLVTLRIYAAMRTGQSSNVFIQASHGISRVERQIALWAGRPGQTAARIRQALAQLQQCGRLPLSSQSDVSVAEDDPTYGLAIDYEQLRDVLEEKKLPRSLSPIDLAYLANKLSFEQVRGQRVLVALTAKNLDAFELVRQRLDQQQLHQQDLGAKQLATSTNPVVETRSKQALQLRSWLQNTFRQDDDKYTAWPLTGLIHQAPWSWLSTSYLLRGEYEATRSFHWFLSTYAQGQVRRLGLQVQLALIAYRLDKGQYPDRLQTLVPEYLPSVPIDPFSGRPLAYEPAGLPYPLATQPGGSAQENGIATHTPLLWSVGICNAVLERFATGHSDDIEASASGQPEPEVHVAPSAWRYRFRSQESPREYNALVFPLPK